MEHSVNQLYQGIPESSYNKTSNSILDDGDIDFPQLVSLTTALSTKCIFCHNAIAQHTHAHTYIHMYIHTYIHTSGWAGCAT